ncbi:MAG: hypothetical protein WDN04_24515 [Rhodospirillales bacterium]
MTDTAAFGAAMQPKEGQFDIYAPANTAPLVAWLVSEHSTHVTGQVFELLGGKLSLSEGWSDGPSEDRGRTLAPGEVGDIVNRLLASRRPAKPVYGTQ